MVMIHTHRQTMGMPTAAMPLLRMQSQTTTLDSLNRISGPPSCEIAEVPAETRRTISSALDVVLQIASQSPSSYSSLARWTVQKPSCAIAEITRRNDLGSQTCKSRLRQLMEKIGALLASVPPIIFVMYLFREECRKVKELQDKCIAIEQRAIINDTWSKIWEICQFAADSVQDHQLSNDPLINIQLRCARTLRVYWQSCQIVLEGAKERCKLAEERYRGEYFRLDLTASLKFLKERYPSV